MVSLQKKITYAGDLKNAPVKNITLEFKIPIYKYFYRDNEIIDKKIVDTETIIVTQAITSKDYQLVLDEIFFTAADGKDFELLVKFMLQSLKDKNLENLFINVDVHYFADKNYKIGEESVKAIYFPDVDPDASSDEPGNSPNLFRKMLFINRETFFGLLKHLAAASTPVDDILLLGIISYLTEVREKQPSLIKEISPELKKRISAQMAENSIEDPSKALEIIKKAFASLYDFPLTIPAIKTLDLGGRFTIVTSDNSTISKKDLMFYDLSAEYSVLGNAGLQILHYEFKDKVTIQDNSVRFSFSDNQAIFKNSIASSILVKVKGFDGSIVWSREFKPEDPKLDSIEIEVPLLKPNVLVPLDKDAFHDKTKKLRGQVLGLNKKCPLKGLTVLVQAKNDGDKIWRIVGAAHTDSSGNFSMPYPFGKFTEAQALVSLAPNHPALIPITALKDGNQTISDDFLYLLIKDVDCPHIEKDEDCDCHAMKKASRLPDYADLIESDEYTQDIGGACVNLSTPNRTLSEFNYQAIVRTSDPEVANYTLKKTVSDQSNLDALANLSAKVARDAQVAKAAHDAQVVKIAKAARDAQIAHDAKVTKIAQAAQKAQVAHTAQVAKIAQATQAAKTADDAHKAALDAFIKAGLEDPKSITRLSDEMAKAAMVLSAANDAVKVAKDELYTQDAQDALDAQKAKDELDAQDAQDALDTQKAKDELDAQDAQDALAALVAQAKLDALARAVSLGTSYELEGEKQTKERKRVALDNPVAWQDAPEAQKELSIYQAVAVATGHILHYKALLKADGYSLGELIYSLALAPGQKKEIVTFDASHTLQGAESQALSQSERLAASIASEREIASQLGGNITEAMRGSSSANTSGISAGFGTGGSGSGRTGAYGGSGSAVLGVAGGVANSNSDASQNSSRDVSQFFGEKLRQSIMQNAESYRQLNASVVTTVQEGQRYSVTSEVVANHNHCHALTMMYFEVLRHYAIFQELSGVEECVFVPLLMTNFTTENIYKWRDVLAQFLLPMPSETYLQPFGFMAGSGRQHPLLKAFDANERVKTNYANVDFPQGSYADEQIRFIKGNMFLRVEFERPQTPYDRIKSLPIRLKNTPTKEIDTEAMLNRALTSPNKVVNAVKNDVVNSVLGLFSGGLSMLVTGPPGQAVTEVVQTELGPQYKTVDHYTQVREAIFDAFMSLDATYENVPPAQCIRIKNFNPTTILGVSVSGLDFFHGNIIDKQLWTAYAHLLGYTDSSSKGPAVLQMLDAYFANNLIAEWDDIFYNQMAPKIFDKIVSSIGIDKISTDFTSETKYKGGERLIRLNLHGTTSKKRNELPLELTMSSTSNDVLALKDLVTLTIEDITILYSTSHYNGMLFSGNVKDDLLDGATLYIPMNSEEQRNPRKEDCYLVYKLIEHLNSNLEHYNKVLWYNLDPDRRFMLLDGFNIEIFKDSGLRFDPKRFRSLASVVKNDLITVTGNSLVFPVAAGYKISQDYILEETEDEKGEKKRITLLDHYQPLTPIKPYRISVPSKGVFAEAVQGACNACEKIETNRLQDWNKFPNTDEPTAISPVTPPTVAITDWKAAFKDFATPMINIQNAPAAPAPGAGLAGLSELLGKSGVFKDITGLEGNQQNVIRTYLSNQENAKAFAQMAKEMAMLAQQEAMLKSKDTVLDSIDEAEASGKIDPEKAKKYRDNTFEKLTLSEPPMVQAQPSDANEWAPWPGVSDNPEPEPKDPKTPTPRPKPKKIIPVSIKFRVFVPSEIWEPYPDALSLGGGVYGNIFSQIRYNGDNRTFAYNMGSSRAEMEYNFRINTETLEVTEAAAKAPIYGWARVYLQKDTTDAPDKPEWWETLDAGATPLARLETKMKHDEKKFYVDIDPKSDRVEVSFVLRAQPYFPWNKDDLGTGDLDFEVLGVSIRDLIGAIGDLAFADINALVKITITRKPNGMLQYSVSGHHDKFPAYELYVNGEQAYKWGDEVQLGDDAPSGLREPMTIEVDQDKVIKTTP